MRLDKLDLALILGCGFSSWILGWLVLTYADIWDYLTFSELHILMVLTLGVIVIVELDLMRRSIKHPASMTTKPETNCTKPEASSTAPPENPDSDLSETVKAIGEKVSDLHAFNQVAKKRAKTSATLPHVTSTFSEGLGLTKKREEMVTKPLIEEVESKEEKPNGQPKP